MKTKKHWNSVKTKLPKVYSVVEARGTWRCKKVLYLDDQENGWEQKKVGQIEVTHWKEEK